MEVSVNKNLFQNVSLVLYIGKFLGYIPVSASRLGNNVTISTSRRWMLLGWSLWFIVAIWITYNAFETSNESLPPIFKVALIQYSSYLEVFMLAMIPGVSVIIIPLRMKYLYKILKSLDQVDKILWAKNIQTSRFRETSVVMITVISVFSWVTFFFNTLSWYNLAEGKVTLLHDFCHRLPEYLLDFYSTLIQLYFCQIAYVIHTRLKKLNEKLQSVGYAAEKVGSVAEIVGDSKGLLVRVTSTANKGIEYDKMEELVQNLVMAHRKLCNAVYNINKVFGVSVLVILLGCMLDFVVTPFYFYIKLKYNADALYAHFICVIMWLLALMIKCILLVDPCGKCSDEIARAKFIARQHRVSSSISEKAKFQLEILSQQLVDCDMDVWVLGICKIDRGILASITGAVTTYLVIMFQFQV